MTFVPDPLAIVTILPSGWCSTLVVGSIRSEPLTMVPLPR